MKLKLDLLLISVIIGIASIYIFAPKPQVILKYPKDDNNVYIDNNNVCYKYDKKYI
ncbi:MAG: hypothetical protein Gaeavirus10_11 [Gaeavirus sp.]|uniref:Uncharacterized protein n=1 Tax=Gaeavirus sp. TaxID=2487767 RepID=A0A3G4ZYW4_9VIRU|nr:MAG: hypothetical protein Gaeavirus10_11 [Gaeavirus sp.]